MQPLALTLGEPAGIGPDLALAVWHRRAELDIPPFISSPIRSFSAAARHGSASTSRSTRNTAERPAQPFPRRFRLLPRRSGERRTRPSGPVERAGGRRLDPPRASPTCCAGAAAAVVTNPVAKNVLYKSGFAEPGHTEFLAKLVQEATGKSLRPVMMLWSPELAVVPVTIHLPLKEIFKQLSTELIVETGRIVAQDCRAASAWHARDS